ncbi:MAG: hypothetical protein HYU42_13535 [Candidatus Rokubacteria bacterium]|nr:hypothetical protein [Candidatus Rokubacteria bacterium]MBI3105697.1 hypothetical protein [Candidatus Rokubacteria bacterium]
MAPYGRPSVALLGRPLTIIDGETVITGSFNFTTAAERQNAEDLLVIHDTALAARSPRTGALTARTRCGTWGGRPPNAVNTNAMRSYAAHPLAPSGPESLTEGARLGRWPPQETQEPLPQLAEASMAP